MSDLAIFGGTPAITEPWPTWPSAGKRERELLEEVLASDLWGGTGLGPKIKELNEKFAQYHDAKYGAAVANGTVSMELCLEAWGIGPGDEVIVPAFTFAATPLAVHHQGATVVYVDIDPKTLNLNPGAVEAAITHKTRAMIPVHIAGHPCDMDPLVELGRKHDIKVLEDAAQAHGAIYRGRKVGAIGDAGSFSFQQSKNMQSGEGGFVTSNDKELIDLIHYSIGKFGRGIREQYTGHIHYRFGWNACYTELQAALALAQFERLDEQTEHRCANAKRLISLMEDIEGLEPYTWQSYCTRHGHHELLYGFISEDFEGVTRTQFLAALNAEGIHGSSMYPIPLYDQPMYAEGSPLSMHHLPCPVTEKICPEIVILEQNLLLAEPAKMDTIVDVMRRIRAQASKLRKLEVEENRYVGSAVLQKGEERAGKNR